MCSPTRRTSFDDDQRRGRRVPATGSRCYVRWSTGDLTPAGSSWPVGGTSMVPPRGAGRKSIAVGEGERWGSGVATEHIGSAIW